MSTGRRWRSHDDPSESISTRSMRRGAASETRPKFISRSDPAAQWTGALKGHAFFAYATNYLIDLDHAIIVDVEATRAIRQAEVGAARTMIDRTEERFGLYPERLAGDSAYGSAEMLGWLVDERGIEPHIPVFDKSARTDGTFSRGLRLRSRQRCLCLPGRSDAHLHGYAGQRRRDAALSRQQTRLRSLLDEAAVLSEDTGAQGSSIDLRRRSRYGP